MTKPYCKIVSKELQYGYSKGRDPLAVCEIFFFLFFGISGTGPPPPTGTPSQSVLRVPHRRCPASCAKKLVRDPDELFCMPKTAGIVKKYDLARFWWAFCLFFSKGQFQSLARQGFVF